MRFEKYFIIWETRETKITLEQAIKVAKREFITDMIYDPLGLGTPESWWFCAGVLEVMQQEDWIREFEIIKKAPEDQQIESKKGVVY